MNCCSCCYLGSLLTGSQRGREKIWRASRSVILFVKFDNKAQSLPRLTLLSSNDECDSVTRDVFILGVFIALAAKIFCVDVAGSTLSGVV